MDHSNDDNELEFDSRTQKKHHAHSMVDLAHRLCELKPKVRNALPLDEFILDSIRETKKITSNIAKKRHFQYLGKLLLNSNFQEILDSLDGQVQKQESGLLRTPFLNMWYEKILEDDSIIKDLYATHDHTEIQTLRQILRVAKKQDKNKEKNQRKLFDFLRELDKKSPLPAF
jgi:ribosome-associated protein